MDYKKVDEALKLVDKAIESTEFQQWVEQNRDTLDCDYDNYKGKYDQFEEPDSFYIWALGCFLREKNATLVKA